MVLDQYYALLTEKGNLICKSSTPELLDMSINDSYRSWRGERSKTLDSSKEYFLDGCHRVKVTIEPIDQPSLEDRDMSMMRCPKCDGYVDTDRTDPYWDLGGEPWHEGCVDDMEDDEMIKYFGTTEPE